MKLHHKQFIKDIRERIGILQTNIDEREKQTRLEFMSLKNFVDLKLHPPKKGYVRFQTNNGLSF